MTCTHCQRELAAVAAIFPGKPAVCGRADCLGWARTLVLPAESVFATAAGRPAACYGFLVGRSSTMLPNPVARSVEHMKENSDHQVSRNLRYERK